MGERDAPLDGDEIEDDGLGHELAALVPRRDRAARRRAPSARRGVAQLVDEACERVLVLVAVELPQVALVGAVLEDDERRVAERELVLPVRAVLALPVDGHRGVRAERVVDDAGLVALERHAEEAHRAAAHRRAR